MATEQKNKSTVGALVPMIVCFLCICGILSLIDIEDLGREPWHFVALSFLVTGGLVSFVLAIVGIVRL